MLATSGDFQLRTSLTSDEGFTNNGTILADGRPLTLAAAVVHTASHSANSARAYFTPMRPALAGSSSPATW